MGTITYSNTKQYFLVYSPRHPKRTVKNYVREHILIAEKAMGHYLPPSAVLHHIDGNGLNNANHNLVVCENSAYHNLLHARKRALKACGKAHWRKCRYCKKYDHPSNLYIARNGNDSYHRYCRNVSRR